MAAFQWLMHHALSMHTNRSINKYTESSTLHHYLSHTRVLDTYKQLKFSIHCYKSPEQTYYKTHHTVLEGETQCKVITFNLVRLHTYWFYMSETLSEIHF